MLKSQELQYLDLIQELYDWALDWTYKLKADRTWVGTYSEVGGQMRFDLSKWFPLLTSKKVFMKAIVHELLWFIAGDTNIKYLVDNDVKIWNEWAYQRYREQYWDFIDWMTPYDYYMTWVTEALECYDVCDIEEREEFKKNFFLTEEEFEKKEWYKKGFIKTQEEFISKIKRLDKISDFVKQFGDLGPIYGYQWRNFNGQGVDQLTKAIEEIKKNPGSRRIIVNAWNPVQLSQMALTPCHAMFQFIVNDWKLSCHMYQRSADMFLGVPFNIASYALLTQMVAQVTWLEVGYFVHSFWDRHIYSNHLDAIKEQLSRKDDLYEFPKLVLNQEVKSIYDFKYEDITVENYQCHWSIKAPIAV